MVLKLSLLAITLMAVSTILATPEIQQPVDSLERRDPPQVIDFTTFPPCANSDDYGGCDISYFEPDFGLTTCDPVACNSTDTGLNCISTDCFCTVSFPLRCGYNCTWGQWYTFEDFYSNICPDTMPTDFSGVPSCARGCLPDQYIIYGCITLGASCICDTLEVFGCTAGCDDASNTTLTQWFATLCGESPDEILSEEPAATSSAAASTTVGTLTMSSTTSSPTQKSKGKGQRVSHNSRIHWYELWAIVVLVVTVASLIGAWVLYQVQMKKAEKKDRKEREKERKKKEEEEEKEKEG
jgi:hypothetical protein